MSFQKAASGVMVLVVFFVAMITNPQVVNAQDGLVPLDQVLSEEISLVTLTYSMERCAGLFAAVSARAANRADRQDAQEFSSELDELGIVFLGSAVDFRHGYTGREQKEFSVSLGEAIEQMSIQNGNYNNLMDAEYARSGNSMSDFVTSDMKTCMQAYQSLNQ